MKPSIWVATASALFCAASAFAETLYSVTPIGSLPGATWTVAYGINNSGEVTGTSGSSEFQNQAFLFDNGVSTNIGGLPGFPQNIGWAINDSGQVAGFGFDGNGTSAAFIYSNGALTGIGTLPGQPYSETRGINNAGQVVGYSFGSGGTSSFLYSNGVFASLDPVLNGLSMAAGINNSGQIVGSSAIFGAPLLGAYHAYLYANGVMTDLGTLGGPQSYGYAINSSGEVTGTSATIFQNPASFPCYFTPNDPVCHAFIYSNGVMTDLGTLPGGQTSAGLGINDSGQVVGYSLVTPNEQHAFVYSNGLMTDLNAALLSSLPTGFTLTDADAINNAGQIVANAANANGQEEAFLLTPAAVPEPSTLALGVAGLLAFTATRRSRQTVFRLLRGDHAELS